jgi:hypothetical protein
VLARIRSYLLAEDIWRLHALHSQPSMATSKILAAKRR